MATEEWSEFSHGWDHPSAGLETTVSPQLYSSEPDDNSLVSGEFQAMERHEETRSHVSFRDYVSRAVFAPPTPYSMDPTPTQDSDPQSPNTMVESLVCSTWDLDQGPPKDPDAALIALAQAPPIIMTSSASSSASSTEDFPSIDASDTRSQPPRRKPPSGALIKPATIERLQATAAATAPQEQGIAHIASFDPEDQPQVYVTGAPVYGSERYDASAAWEHGGQSIYHRHQLYQHVAYSQPYHQHGPIMRSAPKTFNELYQEDTSDELVRMKRFMETLRRVETADDRENELFRDETKMDEVESLPSGYQPTAANQVPEQQWEHKSGKGVVRGVHASLAWDQPRPLEGRRRSLTFSETETILGHIPRFSSIDSSGQAAQSEVRKNGRANNDIEHPSEWKESHSPSFLDVHRSNSTKPLVRRTEDIRLTPQPRQESRNSPDGSIDYLRSPSQATPRHSNRAEDHSRSLSTPMQDSSLQQRESASPIVMELLASLKANNSHMDPSSSASKRSVGSKNTLDRLPCPPSRHTRAQVIPNSPTLSSEGCGDSLSLPLGAEPTSDISLRWKAYSPRTKSECFDHVRYRYSRELPDESASNNDTDSMTSTPTSHGEMSETQEKPLGGRPLGLSSKGQFHRNHRRHSSLTSSLQKFERRFDHLKNGSSCDESVSNDDTDSMTSTPTSHGEFSETPKKPSVGQPLGLSSNEQFHRNHRRHSSLPPGHTYEKVSEDLTGCSDGLPKCIWHMFKNCAELDDSESEVEFFAETCSFQKQSRQEKRIDEVAIPTRVDVIINRGDVKDERMATGMGDEKVGVRAEEIKLPKSLSSDEPNAVAHENDENSSLIREVMAFNGKRTGAAVNDNASTLINWFDDINERGNEQNAKGSGGLGILPSSDEFYEISRPDGEIHLEKVSQRSVMKLEDFLYQASCHGFQFNFHQQHQANPFIKTDRMILHFRLSEKASNSGRFIQPKLVWQNEDQQPCGSINIFEIRSLDMAVESQLKEFPQIDLGRSVVLLTEKSSYVFDAKNNQAASEFIQGMRLLISQLTLSLVKGDPVLSNAFCSCDREKECEPKKAMEDLLIELANEAQKYVRNN